MDPTLEGKDSSSPQPLTPTKYIRNIRSKCKPVFACTAVLLFVGVAFFVFGILVAVLFEDVVEAAYESEVLIQPGSKFTDNWVSPPFSPIFKIYLFNISNPIAFVHKGIKPNLKEVGPYTYKVKWERVNVSWVGNGDYLEYNLKKTYQFVPEMSAGSEDDVLTMMNVPLAAAVSGMKYSGKFVRLGLGSLLDILKQDILAPLRVRDILWGYDHPLVKLGKDIMPPERRFPFELFGLLVGRNATPSGRIRLSTGIADVADLAKVVSYQGRKRLKWWKGHHCNAIKGTDGSLFHPGVTKNETLQVFTSELCQSLPLVYQGETQVEGIPAYRFVPPTDVFDNSDPKRDCFCTADPNIGCSTPNGLFNMSSCQYGSPIMFSWPHFFEADPALLKSVHGLKPDPEKHQSYIDIQPNFGTTMRASIKSQINLEVTAVDGIKNAEGLRDMILPLAWMEELSDTLGQDPEAIAAVQTAVFLPGQTKSGLFVLFFFGGTCIILSALAIIIWVKFELSSEKVRTAASTTAVTCRNACRNLPAHVPEFVTKRLPWEIGPPPSPSPPSETSSNETSDTVTAPSNDRPKEEP